MNQTEITLIRYAEDAQTEIDREVRVVKHTDPLPNTMEFGGNVYRKGVDPTAVRYVSVRNGHGKLRRSTNRVIIID